MTNQDVVNSAVLAMRLEALKTPNDARRLTNDINSSEISLSGPLLDSHNAPLVKKIFDTIDGNVENIGLENTSSNDEIASKLFLAVGKKVSDSNAKLLVDGICDRAEHYTKRYEAEYSSDAVGVQHMIDALTDIYSARPNAIDVQKMRVFTSEIKKAWAEVESDVQQSLADHFGTVALPEHRVITALNRLETAINKATPPASVPGEPAPAGK